MRRTKLYSCLLAAILNTAPVLRTMSNAGGLISAPFAIVMRWVFGAAAVAGSFHAYSAASSVTPDTATATNGVAFRQKFVVMDGQFGTAQSYTASGLPPGLSITVTGVNKGVVTGTPTSSGTFIATIIGHQNSPPEPGEFLSPHAVTFNVFGSGQPPTVQVTPTNSAVAEGSRLVLTATTTGTGPLAFQWLMGDLEVNLATNATLVFDPIKLTDSGSYRVRVGNSFGTVFSTPVSVAVNSAAPQISTPPQSIALHLGESVQLTVGVTGAGPFTYQWESNTVAMPGGTNSALSIVDATPADAAAYSVKVSNSGGGTESSPANVTVAGPLELLAPEVDGAENFIARFVGLTGRIYTVESTTALGGSWTSVGANVAGAGGTNSVVDPTGADARRCYRVRTAN